MKKILSIILILMAFCACPNVKAQQQSAKENIAAMNAQLPAELAEGIIVEKASLDNGNLLLEVSMANPAMTIETLRSMGDALKQVFVATIVTSSDPNVKQLSKFTSEANLGIVFRFIDKSSNQTVDVVIPASDIKSNL